MTSAAVAVPLRLLAFVGGESLTAMSAEPMSERLPGLPRVGLLRGRREAALVREAQGGSEEALEELFRRHWRRAHRAAFLVVGDAAAAEDIAQESFLAAIRALQRFDRTRPFGPWLHRIAVNRAIDFARARKLRRESVLPEATEAGAPDDTGLSDELIAALSELSPEHRAVIVLRYLLGYTPGEIGEILALPRGTVNSRMRRALDRLRPVVEEER
jgi:RNA polymerase sigma-70 factor, ECF subfamily